MQSSKISLNVERKKWESGLNCLENFIGIIAIVRWNPIRIELIWFQRYGHLCVAKNNKIQKRNWNYYCNLLYLKSTMASSDSFCLTTLQFIIHINFSTPVRTNILSPFQIAFNFNIISIGKKICLLDHIAIIFTLISPLYGFTNQHFEFNLNIIYFTKWLLKLSNFFPFTHQSGHLLCLMILQPNK